jgi:alkaline phosphatase D
MLDTRQFRTDQPAGDNFGSSDPDSVAIEAVFGEALFDAAGIGNPDATLLGTAQERWLERELRHSRATWNILAQQVMVMPWNLHKAARATVAFNPAIPEPQKSAILAAIDRVDSLVNVDAWDGYVTARQRLLALLGQVRPRNPVVITGDIHSAWAGNLLADFTDPVGSDLLAAEFVATSISSTFLGIDPRPTDAIVRASLVDNPHIRYFNGLFRGYCLCDVDAQRFETTYRAVGDVGALLDPDPQALVPFQDTPVDTDAVYQVRAGFNAPGSGLRIEETYRRDLPGPF